MIKTKGGEDRRQEEDSPKQSGDSEKMSEKEVDVDCVIFFLSERQMRRQLRIERTSPCKVERKAIYS